MAALPLSQVKWNLNYPDLNIRVTLKCNSVQINICWVGIIQNTWSETPQNPAPQREEAPCRHLVQEQPLGVWAAAHRNSMGIQGSWPAVSSTIGELGGSQQGLCSSLELLFLVLVDEPYQTHVLCFFIFHLKKLYVPYIIYHLIITWSKTYRSMSDSFTIYSGILNGVLEHLLT